MSHNTLTFDHTFVTESKRVLREKLPIAMHEQGLAFPDGERDYIDAACRAIVDVWSDGAHVSDIADLHHSKSDNFAAYCDEFTLTEYTDAGCDFNRIGHIDCPDGVSAIEALRSGIAEKLSALPGQVLRSHFFHRYNVDIFDCNKRIVIAQHNNNDSTIVFNSAIIVEAKQVLWNQLGNALRIHALGFPDDEANYVAKACSTLEKLWRPGSTVQSIVKLGDVNLSNFAVYCDTYSLREYIAAGCDPTLLDEAYHWPVTTATTPDYYEIVERLRCAISLALADLPGKVLRAYFLERYNVDIFCCEETFVW